jgi:hypothetical protein
MSYCKILIGGKERGWKGSQMTVDIIRQMADPEISLTYATVYAGLKANCYAKREEPDFTFEEVCDWCEQLSVEDAQKINAAFQETQAYKKGIAAQEEDTKKKESQSAPENTTDSA